MDGIQTSKSTILGDVEITGSINFKGELFFAGKLAKGSINGGKLHVAKEGEVRGNIVAEEVLVDGAVIGNLTVAQKCDLGGSAEVTGDLKSPRLSMADGATIIGGLQIGPLTAESVAKKK